MNKCCTTEIKLVEIYTKLSNYDYDLPEEFIAQQPLENRDDSKLLVLYRNTGKIEHRKFCEITDYFSPGDFLVLNDTKVVPARLPGNRIGGASIELLFIEEIEENRWKVLIKSNAKLKMGEEIYVGNTSISARLFDRTEEGAWLIEFTKKNTVKELLNRIGEMPLPPYIKRAKNQDTLFSLDRERYQTVFAQKEGAIAAPTAGLPLTKDTFEKIQKRGVEIGFVTLHVGLGTFFPIKTEDIRNHLMHKEYYECSQEIIQKIKTTKKKHRRVIATGSTSCRVLGTIARNGNSSQLCGWTNLFIYPPYNFQYVDVLLTNFHLPKTTLLVLVSAFAGQETILNAYEIAKNEGYRFFSYGDCMMII